jgi:hypothetical protein
MLDIELVRVPKSPLQCFLNTSSVPVHVYGVQQLLLCVMFETFAQKDLESVPEHALLRSQFPGDGFEFTCRVLDALNGLDTGTVVLQTGYDEWYSSEDHTDDLDPGHLDERSKDEQ